MARQRLVHGVWRRWPWGSRGRCASIASRKSLRSSAFSIASRLAPISSTPYFVEHAHVVEGQRGVEAGLAAHGRQQRVGALLLDDLRDDLRGDRLDVGGVGHLRVGHDRGRVGVDQDDPVALLAQRLAGLGAGVVELAGLADDDRARADDHDRADVGALRHDGPCASARRRGRRRGRGFAGSANCRGYRGRGRAAQARLAAASAGGRLAQRIRSARPRSASGSRRMREVGGAVAVEVGGQAAGAVAQLAGVAGEGVAADRRRGRRRGASRRARERSMRSAPAPKSRMWSPSAAPASRKRKMSPPRPPVRRVAAEAAVDAVGAAVAVEAVAAGAALEPVARPRCRRCRRRRAPPRAWMRASPISTSRSTLAAIRGADVGEDGVAAGARGLDHPVAAVVDEIGVGAEAARASGRRLAAGEEVVAGAALDVVAAAAAEELVVAAAAAEPVVAAEADQVVVAQPTRGSGRRRRACRRGSGRCRGLDDAEGGVGGASTPVASKTRRPAWVWAKPVRCRWPGRASPGSRR